MGRHSDHLVEHFRAQALAKDLTAMRQRDARHAARVKAAVLPTVGVLGHRMVLAPREDCGSCGSCNLDPMCAWRMGAFLEEHRPDVVGFYLRPHPDRTPHRWEAAATSPGPFPGTNSLFQQALGLMAEGSEVDCLAGDLRDTYHRVTVQHTALAAADDEVSPDQVLASMEQ